MEQIFIKLVLISSFCVGWFILLKEGMLLEKLGDKIRGLGLLGKPIGGCVPCSSSVVGLAAYALLSFSGSIGLVIVLLVSAVAWNQLLYFPIKYIIRQTEIQEMQAGFLNQQMEEMEYKLEPRRQQAELLEKMRVEAEKSKENCNNGCGDGKDNKI